MPDLIDEVELGADRLGRPATAPGPLDEPDAGVDALHIVVVVGAADRPGADVVVFQLGGWHPPRGQVEALDQAVIVHDVLLGGLCTPDLIGGYWTSLARIGPDLKVQSDGQKQDQFRFAGQPATWLMPVLRMASTACTARLGASG